MKTIYVKSKSTHEVFLRISAFASTKKGVAQCLVRDWQTERQSMLWPKKDLIKITREDNPECFL